MSKKVTQKIARESPSKASKASASDSPIDWPSQVATTGGPDKVDEALRHVRPAQAKALSDAVESVANFIEEGLADSYSRRLEGGIKTLASGVRLQLLEQMARAHDYGVVLEAPTLESRRLERGGAAITVLNGFVWYGERYFGKIAPPRLRIAESMDEDAIALATTCLAPAEGPGQALNSKVLLAYRMARYNTLRCEQRLSLLYFLAGVQTHPAVGKLEPTAQAELDNAAGKLWHQRTTHLMRALAMGVLVGGDAEEECKGIVKSLYGPGKSIIELVEVDGRIPHRWSDETEKQMRREIAKA